MSDIQNQEDLTVTVSGGNDHTRQGVTLIVEHALNQAGFNNVSNLGITEDPPWVDAPTDAPSIMDHIANRYSEFVRDQGVTIVTTVVAEPESEDNPDYDDDVDGDSDDD